MKKQLIIVLTLVVFAISLPALAQTKSKAAEMNSNHYLVIGSEGPGFASPEEAVQVLEKGILPTFKSIMKLQKEKKILAGGLPVGARTFVFIVEASSNKEVDKFLRSLPAWGVLKWKVTALETFVGRATPEREILGELKKAMMK